MSALATVEFAVTPSEVLGQLEAKLSQVFRRSYDRLWRPVFDRAKAFDPSARVTIHEARELIDTLLWQANNEPIRVDMQRRTATIIGSLAKAGLVDVDGEIREVLRGVRASVALEIPNPYRVNLDDALLYESAAGQLVHDHLQAGADQISETIIRGLRQGVDDKAIGERIHKLGMTRLRSHADTWARTETTRWYTLGRTRMAEEAGDAVWGYEYVVILDDRTTDICRAFVGKRVAKDAIREFPPFHWNCRTGVRAIMAEWVTGKDPERNLLGDDVAPAEGWGGDPRGAILRATGGLP